MVKGDKIIWEGNGGYQTGVLVEYGNSDDCIISTDCLTSARVFLCEVKEYTETLKKVMERKYGY